MSAAISAYKGYLARFLRPFVVWGVHVLLMLFVLICAYWRPTRFRYHVMFSTFTSNMTGVTSVARTVSRSEEGEFTPCFSGVRVTRSLVFCVVFCRLLFVILSFSFDHCIVCPSIYVFWLLLGILDLRLLITSWYLRFTSSDYFLVS
jgi:hypothetical protein